MQADLVVSCSFFAPWVQCRAHTPCPSEDPAPSLGELGAAQHQPKPSGGLRGTKRTRASQLFHRSIPAAPLQPQLRSFLIHLESFVTCPAQHLRTNIHSGAQQSCSISAQPAEIALNDHISHGEQRHCQETQM